MSILKNIPKSPVTGSDNVKVVDTFSTEDIIKLYGLQEDLDVKVYFRDYETVYILECQDTGYRFYYPFEIIGDESFYKNLQSERGEKGMEYDRDWADDHKFAYDQIQNDEKLLEIGCGTGKFLSEVSKKTKNVSGLELNSTAAHSAIKKGFDVQNKLAEEYAEDNPNKYDVVCAFQVLEHIAEVQSFLTACLKLLKPDGRLIFSVPNNEPFFQRFSKYEVLNLPPHHMGLWNLDAFKKLCDFYDMSLVNQEFSGSSTFRGDVYLRAKLMANVKSLPHGHSLAENLKILTVAPIAGVKSTLDYLAGKSSFGYLSVIFQKKMVAGSN